MGVLPLFLMVCSAIISSALGRSKLTAHHKDFQLSSETNSSISCDEDYSCLDCTTVQVCAPGKDGVSLYEIDRFKCDSSKPYCNYTSGTCSYNMDTSCYSVPNVTVSNFTCMRNGYFPDPYNCSLYYHCQNEIAYQFSCVPPYSYYNPAYESCVSYNGECANFTAYYCRYYDSGTKLGLGYTQSHFIYCGYNSTVVAVDRCIGAYYFDSNAQICLPSCPNAGLFPKDDDCANYYKCSPKSHGWGNNEFIMTDMTCPEGQAFSESEYACVDRSLVPNCNVPYPALFNK